MQCVRFVDSTLVMRMGAGGDVALSPVQLRARAAAEGGGQDLLISEFPPHAVSRRSESDWEWVIENDKDFDAVCNLAGVNPDQFRAVTLKSVTERYDRAFLAQVFAQHFNFGR